MWGAKILVYAQSYEFTAQFYCHYMSSFSPHTSVTVVRDMFFDEIIIRQSVNCLCRDGTDMHIVHVHWRAC